MDPSYVQFITSLMNEEGDAPTSRRPSIGFPDDFLSDHSDLMRERALSFSRDRGFSWDAGFEDLDNPDRKETGYTIQDIIQSIGHSYESYPASSADPAAIQYPVQMPMAAPDRRVSYDVHSMIPDRSDADPSYMNMMPGVHPELHRLNPHAHLYGVGMNMQMFRPLISNLGMSLGMNMGLPSIIDEANIRVGAYTKEERQVRIAKFRAKKNRRVWKKQIKYDCRKKLADNRPRIKGRFVTRKDDDEPDHEHDETYHENDEDFSDPNAHLSREGSILDRRAHTDSLDICDPLDLNTIGVLIKSEDSPGFV